MALLSLLLSAAIPSLPGDALAFQNADCLGCHAEVDQASFERSIHGRNPCTSCHADIKETPHAKRPGPVKCGGCHHTEQQILLASDHGRAAAKGETEAASCEACHGDHHSLLAPRDPESPASRQRINRTCASCHGDEKKMEPYHLTQREPYRSYRNSIHGRSFEAGEVHAAVCTDCHGSHDINTPINPESKIYKFNVPATCGRCHENIYKTYLASIHARGLFAGVKDAPVCTDCHGEHPILPHDESGSPVHASSIVKTCSGCHASEKLARKYGLPVDATETYLGSYHGIAFQYGTTSAANCASCHGFHDILPSSDVRSSINPDNLGRTCGKCHPGAGELLSHGSVHIRPSVDRDRVIFYVGLFYLLLIAVVIGGMLLHNAIDLSRKMAAHYREAVKKGVAVRMGRSERIWHIVLLISFAVLVYTGFAHKYPNTFFSYPFGAAESGAMVRKVIHRAAGVVFILLMGYHALWMVGTAHGRKKLAALLPRWRDVTDAIGLVAFNLGLSRHRPKFARFSYIEKAEYWALLWGSLIMILTGLVLMFENVSLHYFPKWLIDVMLVVHFFEAVLATLAILVWHLYWVIFDPEVYPMNWTWLTGKVTEKQLEEREEEKKGEAGEDATTAQT